MIEMGGNDIRDALATYVSGGGSASAVLEEANVSIANAIVTLYGAGRETIPRVARTQRRADAGEPARSTISAREPRFRGKY